MTCDEENHISLRDYIDTIHAADLRYREEQKETAKLLREADQRALQIKETADQEALRIASNIQTYKDEKANELRAQLAGERLDYATKEDLQGVVRELKATYGEQRQDGYAQHTARNLDVGQILTIALLVLVAIGTIISIIHI